MFHCWNESKNNFQKLESIRLPRLWRLDKLKFKVCGLYIRSSSSSYQVSQEWTNSKPQDNLKTCFPSTQNSFRFFIVQFALSTFPIDVLHSNQMSQSLSRIQHRSWRVVPEQLAKMSKEFFLSFIRQRKSRKSEAMGESRTINNENNSISHNCSFDKLPVMCRCNDIIIYCSTSGDESERGGGKDDVDGEKLK